MADVIVAIIHFPNDPTHNNVAHQMFIATQTESTLDLYSISSILGKERRVYGAFKDDYVTILQSEVAANGFRAPSFIDCTKLYQVTISSNVNLSALSQRKISNELRQRIEKKINEKKTEGRLTVYRITEQEFCTWNPKV